MQSWRFNGTDQPLTLYEVFEPHTCPGQIVVDVRAAGVCHSDVSTIDDAGWMSLFPRIPITFGHENAGVIAGVGPGMKDLWKVGDRVVLSFTFADGDAIDTDSGTAASARGSSPRTRTSWRSRTKSRSSSVRWRPTRD